MKFHGGGEGGVVAEQFGRRAIEARPRWLRGLSVRRDHGETGNDRRKNNKMLFHNGDGLILCAACL
jgi:hypothetical protein